MITYACGCEYFTTNNSLTVIFSTSTDECDECISRKRKMENARQQSGENKNLMEKENEHV